MDLYNFYAIPKFNTLAKIEVLYVCAELVPSDPKIFVKIICINFFACMKSLYFKARDFLEQ